MKLGDNLNALNQAERSRSRTFLDLLSWTELHISPNPELTEVKREAELRHSLRAIMLAQRETRAEPLRRALALEYSELQAKLEAVLETIYPHSPEYVALRRSVPVSFRDIQQCLLDTP